MQRLILIGTWLVCGLACLFFTVVFCGTLHKCLSVFSDPKPITNLSASIFALVLSGTLAILSGLVIRKQNQICRNLAKKGHKNGLIHPKDNIGPDVFRFSPDLFEYRNNIITQLHEQGFDWLTHYSSVDPMQDVYGMEVCGIHDEDNARNILEVLKQMFPSWTIRKSYYKDFGRDPGFMVTIQRDSELHDEQWETR